MKDLTDDDVRYQAREIRRQAEAIARRCKKLEEKPEPARTLAHLRKAVVTHFWVLEARIRIWEDEARESMRGFSGAQK